MASPEPSAEPVDATSRRIVAELLTDGRSSYANIGKAIGMSEAAVRQRVQRLIERGVIRVRALLDPASFDLRRRALLGVKVHNEAIEVARSLSDLPDVLQVDVSTGRYDIVAEVLVRDDEALMGLLDSVRRLPSIRSVDSIVLLHRAKHATDWVLPLD